MSNEKHVDTQNAAAESNGGAAPSNGKESAPTASADASEASASSAVEPDVAASDAAAQEPADQIEALEAERDELNDRLLRQAAEFQNVRRRLQREKKQYFQAGKKEVILPMLDVLDDFQRSLEAAEQMATEDEAGAAYESLRSGVELVFQKFLDELKNLGVEPIEAEGQPFDEHEHEAMMQQPAPDDVEPGTVLKELRTGYRLGDQVLRHSRVIVAS